MKSLYKFSLILAALTLSSAVLAQGTLKGTVIDINGNKGLPGASVTIKGTNIGGFTDMNGNFNFEVPASGAIEIKFVGYNTITRAFSVASGEMTNLGKIGLAANSTLLGDVVIVGVADIAKDRKTPVAVSTIKASEIQDKLGSQELPEILNNTPSVYATKAGGGFGDSRISIRGFSQENIAVMINGVPVNDMENGAVFWSNWAGLADVTTGIQVQRGLGSSKLAISSVGGTINILTKTTDAKKGGSMGAVIGNDGYNKVSASYSSGKLESGLAVSALFSRTSGYGYANSTEFEGYNYFLGFGWENEKNNVQFTVTGAPQVHNQRTTSFFNMATLEDYLDHGTKYNFNQGRLDSKDFNWRRNFYHKPVASVNWDLNLTDKSSISTAAYASYGRGGGTGDIGRVNGRFNFASSSNFRDENGNVQYDGIAASNGGTEFAFNESFSYGNSLDPETNTYVVNSDVITADSAEVGSNGYDYYHPGITSRNGIVRRASINSHNWIGVISNYSTTINNELTFDMGIDLRSYRGIHYRRLDDLLGAPGFRDPENVNQPMNIVSETYDSNIGSLWNVFRSTDDDKKINYHNDGLVRWAGAFTQLEYSKDQLTTFIQGAVSSQSFRRIDYFSYLDSDPLQETDWKAILGGNIKGGANYNLDEYHNVYINGGFYSKQPNFDAVYLNNDNVLNDDIKNEKVVGVELGYGLRTKKISANLNLYNTSWKDRYIPVQTDVDVLEIATGDTLEVEAFASLYDAQQIHRGLEIDGTYRVTDKLKVLAMLSVGNWVYGGNVEPDYVDDNGSSIENIISEKEISLDGIKVGDAAQFTTRLGLDYKPSRGLTLDASWRLVDDLYSGLFIEEPELGALKLPSYNLMDAGISYKLLLDDKNAQSLSFRLNVNNVFDTVYISESATNDVVDAETNEEDIYNGINKSNKVFFGFGTTWNFGVRYNF
ncbi:MAG: hypothetical protein ACI8XB_001314 [Patiriisocius sp.]|jgi:hypothetical protein